MFLESLTIQGFRRFHELTSVVLSGKMVAIVGSNEAGKTSLLKAISLYGSNEDFSYSDRSYLGSNATKIVYKFFLSDDDLTAARLTAPSWLSVTKATDGKRTYSVSPRPDRDYEHRSSAAKLLRKFLASAKTRTAIAKAEISLDYDLIEPLIELLDLRAGPYSAEQSDKIGNSLAEISKAKDLLLPAYVIQLIESLSVLLEFEANHDPHQYAINTLFKRLPPILYFGSRDRDIGLPYSLALFQNGDPSSQPSRPLAQVISLSGLDMSELVDADKSGNDAVRTGLLASANEKLRELSQGLWSQSDASLFLTVSNGALDILVEHKDGFDARDRYNNLRDRSDGYRQFVALQIFAFLQSTSGAILIIDEIEQHLHYDAQADLVQLLQNEKSIQKVIYTTHSAGALPEDLGTGIKLVHWDENSRKYSLVNNKFWYRAEHEGFKPLLFGMGATTLAFFPTRKALIAEGVTEMLLLPRLLRDALEVSTLGFQIIHGLSNISPKGLPMIDSTVNGVMYIVDGDGGGKDLTDSLKAANVSPERILSLKSTGSVTVEDLIDNKLWRQAVTNLSMKFNPGLIDTLSADKFPENGRIDALPKLISGRKIEIAYEILRLSAESPGASILSAKKKARLKGIAQDALAGLKIVTGVD